MKDRQCYNCTYYEVCRCIDEIETNIKFRNLLSSFFNTFKSTIAEKCTRYKEAKDNDL